MAHALSLTDGTTTINLSDLTNTMVTAYTPVTPDLDPQEALALADGGEFAMVNLRNVVETADLLLMATTKPNLQSLINSIETMVQTARRRQRVKAGPRVYLQLTVDGDGSVYRSEIMGARLALHDDALVSGWPNIKVGARLHIQRRFFWEGPEVELQLSTSNQGAATGGRTIVNHDDGGAGDDNWVQIASSQVKGVLPTPARITLQNTSGSSQSYRNLHLAVNAFSDPANFVHIVEGEAAGSGTNNANSSGGQYLNFAFSGTSGILWTLSGSQMQKAAGQRFRLLARFSSISGGGFYAKPIIRNEFGLTDLFEGEEVYVDSAVSIVDLGDVPLPPSGAGVSWTDMTLYLQLRSTTSVTIALDFIQLTPTDSYVHLIQRGYQIVNNGTITIDGVEGVVHAGGQPIYISLGMPLLLFPSRTQRVIVLHDEATGTPAIANSFSVRVYCRPRRLTV